MFKFDTRIQVLCIEKWQARNRKWFQGNFIFGVEKMWNFENKIKQNLDLDNLFIPGDQSNFKFILKADIHYTPLGVNNGTDYKCGNYVCWKKEQNVCLKPTSTFHEKF